MHAVFQRHAVVPDNFYSGIFCFPGDRRSNKMNSYNYEPSPHGGSRNFAPAEPEWYTEGPISQSDTIELHGFDGAHGEGSRARNTSGSDASHDDGQLDGQKTKADRRSKGDRGGKTGSIGSSSRSRDVVEATDTVPNAVFDDERHRHNCCGLSCAFFILFLF